MTLKPLRPSDYPHLKKFFENQRHRLCVYSLSSLLIWTSRIYQPCGAVLDDDTLLVGIEYSATFADRRHLILPVSPTRECPPEELRDLANRFGFFAYWFVPGEYIERHGRERIEAIFDIKEQPDLHDYIYLREDLAELKGNKYAKKRNLINQFLREYREDRIQAEKINAALVPECLDFLEKWCEERRCTEDPEGLSCEKMAAGNSLEQIDRLGMEGILLRVDGEVSAFGVASRLTRDMGALHFEKAFAGVKGLYQFFDRLCARRLFEARTYINKESDMEDPGIAKAKKSYHPVELLKSYELRVKG